MPCISKIKLVDNIYNVKDSEVENILKILLSGQEQNVINENDEELPPSE